MVPSLTSYDIPFPPNGEGDVAIFETLLWPLFEMGLELLFVCSAFNVIVTCIFIQVKHLFSKKMRIRIGMTWILLGLTPSPMHMADSWYMSKRQQMLAERRFAQCRCSECVVHVAKCRQYNACEFYPDHTPSWLEYSRCLPTLGRPYELCCARGVAAVCKYT